MKRFDSIVVHCGLPKTGSTSLQSALMARAAALETAGICYPRVPGFDGNHSFPILLFLGIQTYEPFGPVNVHLDVEAWAKAWADLESGALSPDCHKLLISAECLWALPAEEGARFFRFLESMLSDSGGFEAIGFVRHPVDWMNSMRNEFAKIGFTLPRIHTFLNAHWRDPSRLLEVAAELRSATPFVQWHVGEHETLAASGGIVPDFWSRFSLPGTPPESTSTNESLCFEALAVLSILATARPVEGFDFRLFQGVSGSPSVPDSSEIRVWWETFAESVNAQLTAWGLAPYDPPAPRTVPAPRPWSRTFFDSMERRLEEVDATPAVRKMFWQGVRLAAKQSPLKLGIRFRLKWQVFAHRNWLNS
jgi:hypothetical protein